MKVTLITLGILGASLFYGDGVITPAISVLSAVEGLKVAAPSIDQMVVPITVAVLTALFAIQRFGTGVVGGLFGPVMLVWFAVIGVIGLGEIIPHPEIVKALLPSYGVRFFVDHRVLRSSLWDPSCSRSRAPRRSTPTWGSSGARRSAEPGSSACFRL